MTAETEAEGNEPSPGYLRRNLLAWVVIAAFAGLGWFLGPLVAPDIVRWRSGLAGAMLGAFSGGAAVLNRLLD